MKPRQIMRKEFNAYFARPIGIILLSFFSQSLSGFTVRAVLNNFYSTSKMVKPKKKLLTPKSPGISKLKISTKSKLKDFPKNPLNYRIQDILDDDEQVEEVEQTEKEISICESLESVHITPNEKPKSKWIQNALLDEEAVNINQLEEADQEEEEDQEENKAKEEEEVKRLMESLIQDEEYYSEPIPVQIISIVRECEELENGKDDGVRIHNRILKKIRPAPVEVATVNLFREMLFVFLFKMNNKDLDCTKELCNKIKPCFKDKKDYIYMLNKCQKVLDEIFGLKLYAVMEEEITDELKPSTQKFMVVGDYSEELKFVLDMMESKWTKEQYLEFDQNSEVEWKCKDEYEVVTKALLYAILTALFLELKMTKGLNEEYIWIKIIEPFNFDKALDLTNLADLRKLIKKEFLSTGYLYVRFTKGNDLLVVNEKSIFPDGKEAIYFWGPRATKEVSKINIIQSTITTMRTHGKVNITILSFTKQLKWVREEATKEKNPTLLSFEEHKLLYYLCHSLRISYDPTFFLRPQLVEGKNGKIVRKRRPRGIEPDPSSITQLRKLIQGLRASDPDLTRVRNITAVSKVFWDLVVKENHHKDILESISDYFLVLSMIQEEKRAAGDLEDFAPNEIYKQITLSLMKMRKDKMREAAMRKEKRREEKMKEEKMRKDDEILAQRRSTVNTQKTVVLDNPYTIEDVEYMEIDKDLEVIKISKEDEEVTIIYEGKHVQGNINDQMYRQRLEKDEASPEEGDEEFDYDEESEDEEDDEDQETVHDNNEEEMKEQKEDKVDKIQEGKVEKHENNEAIEDFKEVECPEVKENKAVEEEIIHEVKKFKIYEAEKQKILEVKEVEEEKNDVVDVDKINVVDVEKINEVEVEKLHKVEEEKINEVQVEKIGEVKETENPSETIDVSIKGNDSYHYEQIKESSNDFEEIVDSVEALTLNPDDGKVHYEEVTSNVEIEWDEDQELIQIQFSESEEINYADVSNFQDLLITSANNECREEDGDEGADDPMLGSDNNLQTSPIFSLAEQEQQEGYLLAGPGENISLFKTQGESEIIVNSMDIEQNEEITTGQPLPLSMENANENIPQLEKGQVEVGRVGEIKNKSEGVKGQSEKGNCQNVEIKVKNMPEKSKIPPPVEDGEIPGPSWRIKPPRPRRCKKKINYFFQSPPKIRPETDSDDS